jgi:hypothetical protein
MDLSELWHKALDILPTSLVGTDDSGELVIYTGLRIENGDLVEYDRSEEHIP